MHKTIFLDRDGVINRCAAEHCYICSWEEFAFLPGVAQAIRTMNAAGYLVLVVTNQRGVARGLLPREALDALHWKMQAALLAAGAHIDNIYVCPHEEGTCTCRKPDIGLFQMAEADYEIDKAESWMIGDSASDVLAGQKYGVRTIRTTNLREAVAQILDAERSHELEMVR